MTFGVSNLNGVRSSIIVNLWSPTLQSLTYTWLLKTTDFSADLSSKMGHETMPDKYLNMGL